MKENKISNNYVIGIDFGTDSVRSILLDTDGRKIKDAVHLYSRWSKGLYCDNNANQFRHHPLDYLEGLEATLKEIVDEIPDDVARNIKAISIAATGSTPVAVDRTGKPLALNSDFGENPNAMFILWKDHTAIKEANEITELAKTWGGIDYTKYVGGVYSSEWFWAKILHTIRTDGKVNDAAYSWVELCDWIPYELTGKTDVHQMKRSRCAAGHKALWHEEFGGLPSDAFLNRLDPLLAGLRGRLFKETYTSDQPAGVISKNWAERLGLPGDVVIGVGAFDAHMGAVGGEIEPHYLSRVMGTSTCDILVAPAQELQDKQIKGICGQVDGSVIPGMIGLEAGQSSFGDAYAWFKDLLLEPFEKLIKASEQLDSTQEKELLAEAEEKLLVNLFEDTSNIKIVDTDIIALDWLNGRRTPDANQLLKAAFEGLDLSSNAPKFLKRWWKQPVLEPGLL